MHFSVPLLVLVAIANVLLGLLVVTRSPKEFVSRAFGLMTLSIVVWSLGLAGFYLTSSVDSLAPFIKTFYLGALSLGAFSLMFVGAYIRSRNKLLYVWYPLLSLSIVSSVVLFSNDLIEGVVKQEFGADVALDPLLYAIYSITVSSYFFVTFVSLMSGLHKGSAQERSQTRIILAGVTVTGGFALYFNLLLPWLGQYDYVWSGPLFTTSFIGSISYAILKHRLFDIRAVAARAAAYILATSFLVLLYVGLANIIQILFSSDAVVSGSQFLSSMALTVVLVILYPFAKRYFDKITNSIFYRDAYDTQTFLDDLNNVLVANIDVEKLLEQSCDLIEQSIKSEFTSFFVLNTQYFDNRLVGDSEKRIDKQEARQLHRLLPKIRKKVIYVQDAPLDIHEQQVTAILKQSRVEVLVRIVDTLDHEVDGIGYLLLGQKRSGNPYNAQDLKVLEIVGNELELAVENALRFEEIQQFNVTLQNKITDATKELTTSNDKLKALDEAKDEFVSMASHQLRTPLTSIKGYVSMVIDGDAGEINEQQKQMLGQALFSSQRMVYLISDLLNVSRLRTGKFLVERQPTYLPDVIASEIDQVKEGAHAKNITLIYDKPKNFPKLNLDEMKTRQVIMNFIDNAIYYTPTGGKITLALKNRKESVELTVKDTGIGVPKAQQHKLFTKFYRADNARSARPDGTGLGLFMAKKVIIAQGGSLLFHSKENKGSTFGFSFPKNLKKLAVIKDSKSLSGISKTSQK